jgi:di/tripeptidase
MELKAKKVEYSFTPDDIKKLIAKNLGVAEGTIKVHYKIQEVGADPMDRFPGTKEVTEINVTVTSK